MTTIFQRSLAWTMHGSLIPLPKRTWSLINRRFASSPSSLDSNPMIKLEYRSPTPTSAAQSPSTSLDTTSYSLLVDASAVDQLDRITKDESKALKISIEAGGCQGFQSQFELISIPPSLLPNIQQPSTSPSATLATEASSLLYSVHYASDLDALLFSLFSRHHTKRLYLWIDTVSMSMISGATLSYRRSLIASKFILTDIPLSGGACGCGVSFNIK